MHSFGSILFLLKKVIKIEDINITENLEITEEVYKIAKEKYNEYRTLLLKIKLKNEYNRMDKTTKNELIDEKEIVNKVARYNYIIRTYEKMIQEKGEDENEKHKRR